MQRRKSRESNAEDIPVHSHESSTDYNLRVQDRHPRSKGRSDVPWSDCRILRKWKCDRGHVWADLEIKNAGERLHMDEAVR